MIYELKTELRYRLCISSFLYDDGLVELDICAKPDFEAYNNEIKDDCVVLDVDVLLSLLELEGERQCYPMTCECGWAEDVGINAPLLYQMTDTEIYWDIPVEKYTDIIKTTYAEQGIDTLRLIFNKTDYSETVVNLARKLKYLSENGIRRSELIHYEGTRVEYSRSGEALLAMPEYAHIEVFQINVINPS